MTRKQAAKGLRVAEDTRADFVLEPRATLNALAGPSDLLTVAQFFGTPSLGVGLSSFGYLGISANFLQQRSRRFRNSNFAVQNSMAVHIVAIHGFVSAFVGLHDSAAAGGPPDRAKMTEIFRRHGMTLAAHPPVP